jgi:hypothetical protein
LPDSIAIERASAGESAESLPTELARISAASAENKERKLKPDEVN